MIRRFTNVSGSPEKKMRRQSPVIGGARVYPGSSHEFNDLQWESLGSVTRSLLMALVATGVADYEERVEIHRNGKSFAKAEPSKSDQKSLDGKKQEMGAEAENQPIPEEPMAKDLNIEMPKAEESEVKEPEVEKSEEAENKEPEEVEKEELEVEKEELKSEKGDSGFDYEAFLNNSVANIRKNGLPDPKPSIEKLIALEKGEKNRKSVIDWLEQSS